MSELKTFDARIIGSITSGVLLLEGFSKVHEAIEWLAGHPVWTHELPAVSDRLTPSLIERFPDLPTEMDGGSWQKCAALLTEKYPNGIELEKGTGERASDPLTTLEKSLAQGGSIAP